MESNIKQHVVFTSPKNIEERTEVAGACVRNLHLQIPALLDGFDNPTERAYTGWPDRLYIIDRSGKVAFKSQPGPFGFSPMKMNEALRKQLARSYS